MRPVPRPLELPIGALCRNRTYYLRVTNPSHRQQCLQGVNNVYTRANLSEVPYVDSRLPRESISTPLMGRYLFSSVFNCTISSAASVFASHNLSSRCNLLEYCACENRACLFPAYHRVTSKANSKFSKSVWKIDVIASFQLV